MNRKLKYFILIFVFLFFISHHASAANTILTTAKSSFTVDNFGIASGFSIGNNPAKAWLQYATVFGIIDGGTPFEINNVNLIDGEPAAHQAPFPGAYFQAGRFEDYSYDGASLNVYSNVNYHAASELVFSHGHKIIDPSPTLGVNYVEWQPIYQVTNAGNVSHTIKTFRYVEHVPGAAGATFYSKGYDNTFNTNDDYSIFIDNAYNFFSFSGINPSGRSTRLQNAAPNLYNEITAGAANYSLDNSVDLRAGNGETAWMYGPYTLNPGEAIIINYPTQKMLQIDNNTLTDIDYAQVNVSAAGNKNFAGTDVSINFANVNFIGGQYEAAPATNLNVPNNSDITVIELTGGMIIRNPNPGIGNVSTARYWEISADTRVSNFNASITFTYNPAGDHINHENTLKLVRRMSIGDQWTPWPNADIARNPAGDTITANNVVQVGGMIDNLGQWALLPINEAPVASGQNLNTNEDAPINNIVLGANDNDADPLQYIIVQNPQNGVLNGIAPNLIYSPNANYNGQDSFTFKVNDGDLDSNIATINITVNSVNDLPIANNQNLVTAEDTPLNIVLTGADPVENSPLQYTIAQNPQNGILSGNPPNLTYIPNANYNGQDSFTFKVNDGSDDSNIGTISINVTSVNDIPLAFNQNLSTNEDTPFNITLTGQDFDNRVLSYILVQNSGPQNGQLINNPPNLLYTPNNNFHGVNTFMFKVTNGVSDSNPATITITVNSINDAPLADYLTFETDENTPINITLTAIDPENDPMIFSIVDGPTHGVLNGNPPNVTYVPDNGFSGNDSFRYKANDGLSDSNYAAVGINVLDVNEAPVAQNQNIVTNTNTPIDIVLTATDIENEALTFTIINPPTQGNLNGVPPNMTYIPNDEYTGQDNFTFTANDGNQNSNMATVNIQVNAPVNNLPTANNQDVNTNQNNSINIILTGQDPEGANLSYIVVNNPSHGVLQGNPPNITYVPNNGYSGQDNFTFKVTDGVNDSDIATVNIQVKIQEGNDPIVNNKSDNKKSPCIINTILDRKKFSNELNNITTFCNKYLLTNTLFKIVTNKYYQYSPVLSKYAGVRFILSLIVLPVIFIINNSLTFFMILLSLIKVFYTVKNKML